MSSWLKYAREFKPPVIKLLLICSKDLFKKSREDGSIETKSSKSPFLASLTTSPPIKKIRTKLSSIGTSSQFTPLAAQAYSVGVKTSTFAHLSGDMILPQSMVRHSAKTIGSIMDYSAGYSFHDLTRHSGFL
ncbi:hypothetical protein AgCh_018379 [Apium graveolens]